MHFVKYNPVSKDHKLHERLRSWKEPDVGIDKDKKSIMYFASDEKFNNFDAN